MTEEEVYEMRVNQFLANPSSVIENAIAEYIGWPKKMFHVSSVGMSIHRDISDVRVVGEGYPRAMESGGNRVTISMDIVGSLPAKKRPSSNRNFIPDRFEYVAQSELADDYDHKDDNFYFDRPNVW